MVCIDWAILFDNGVCAPACVFMLDDGCMGVAGRAPAVH
jgi:hypothetical protein